jgi:hypothetical protein
MYVGEGGGGEERRELERVINLEEGPERELAS